MKPDTYRELDHPKCCGKCRFAGYQPNTHDYLMCYLNDSAESVNNSMFLDGEEVDPWWADRHVDHDGLCDEFRQGEPQDVTWANDYRTPLESD